MNPPLVFEYDGHAPDIAPDAFVAPGCTVHGRVRLARGSSVWYGSVLRGDNDLIDVGEECNIQDGSILHTDVGRPVTLGARVTVGHGAIVHGATVAADALIGMRAVLLNGSRVGRYSIVAAGAVVTPGTEIPDGVLAAGVPARVLRDVTDEERAMIDRTAKSYASKAAKHADALAAAGGRP